MAKYVPKILEPILNYVPSPGMEEAVSYASKAIRAKIIADRYTRGFERADRRGPKDAYDNGPKGGEEPAHRELLPDGRRDSEGYTSEPVRLSRISAPVKNYISIVDIDYDEAEHANSRHYSYLQLPFVPEVLNYNPTSNFVGIASFGSNNPIYHYTGSEDTLTFTIDWFSNQNNRQDVIFNCRWLEALTKSDGYNEAPHRVVIVWGGHNAGENPIPNTQEWENPGALFENSVWVLVEAPYKLSQFVRGYRDPETGLYVNTNMLPQQAIQTVTFKRITNFNRTSQEIIGNLGTNR